MGDIMREHRRRDDERPAQDPEVLRTEDGESKEIEPTVSILGELFASIRSRS